MDLLPHPSLNSGGVPALEIQFVADAPYTGGNFWDFPQTHGFGDRWATLPASRLASLAQSWLYFGTISQFLGKQIDYCAFKRLRDGFAFDDRGSVVTAEPLLVLLDEWFGSRERNVAPKKPSKTWRNCAGNILPIFTSNTSNISILHELEQHAMFLDKVFDLAEDFEELSQGHIHPIPAICLSVKVLCITLSNLLRERIQIETGHLPISWPKTVLRKPGTRRTSSLPSSQLLLDTFQQQGWCPFQAGKVMLTHNYAVVYYFTRLYKHFSPNLSHRQCSETECVASNVTYLDDYQPRHTDPSCQCRHLSVRQDQIRNIIMEGGIPLVRVTSSSRRKPLIKVVKMTPWTRFVAFSHVWSDTGLGNPRFNSLPKCQLQRLQGFADKGDSTGRVADQKGETQDFGKTNWPKTSMSRSRYFWIDTLCIPAVDPGDEARIQAINKMGLALQAAEKVLVLDQSLQNISLAVTERCEVLSKLSVSPWNGRCWTFMEACLSSVCEVQCADGTINPFWDQQTQEFRDTRPLGHLTPITSFTEKILQRSPALDRLLQPQTDKFRNTITRINTVISSSLSKTLTSQFRSYLSINSNTNLNQQTAEKTDLCTLFVSIWNELSNRSTTLAEDKHIILASLLGFNTQYIMRLRNPKSRMNAIFRSMDGLPISLFLSNNLPRELATDSHDRNHHNNWVPLYPSKQRLKLGSRYTNIRSDLDGDLYFPNNRMSRRETSIFIMSPGSGLLRAELHQSSEFKIRDTTSNPAEVVEYSIRLDQGAAGEDGTKSPFSGGHDVSYCILIQQSSQHSEQPGVLFRIQSMAAPHPPPEPLPYPRRLKNGSLLFNLSSETIVAQTPSGAQMEFPRNSNCFKGLLCGQQFAASELSLILAQKHEMPGLTVRVSYECQVTVSSVEHVNVPFMFGFPSEAEVNEARPVSPLVDQPVVDATPLPPTWQMVLGQEEQFETIPERLTIHIPTYKESSSTPPISATILLTALDGLVAAGSVSLCFAICFVLLPRNIPAPLASAAVILKIITHALSIIWIFLFDDPDNKTNNLIHSQQHNNTTNPFYTTTRFTLPGLNLPLHPRIWALDTVHLLLAAIYTVSRLTSSARNNSHLNILDRTFIHWSFAGHAVNILTHILVIRYWVTPVLWREYLASFDDNYHHARDEGAKPHSTEEEEEEAGKKGRGISPSPSEEAEPGDDDGLIPADELHLAGEFEASTPVWEPLPQQRQYLTEGFFFDHSNESIDDGLEVVEGSVSTTNLLLPPLSRNMSRSATVRRPARPTTTATGTATAKTPWWDVSAWKPMEWLELGGGLGAGRRAEKTRQKRTGKKGGRRRPITDSMVVEGGSDTSSRYFGRSSWRSGDYLLGEQLEEEYNTRVQLGRSRVRRNGGRRRVSRYA